MARVLFGLCLVVLAGCGAPVARVATATAAPTATIAPTATATAAIAPQLAASLQALAAERETVAQSCGITTQQVAYDQSTVVVLLEQYGMPRTVATEQVFSALYLASVWQLHQEDEVDCTTAFVTAGNQVLARYRTTIPTPTP